MSQKGGETDCFVVLLVGTHQRREEQPMSYMKISLMPKMPVITFLDSMSATDT